MNVSRHSFTMHGHHRCQQRAIKQRHIDALESYGSVNYNRGCEILLFSKKGWSAFLADNDLRMAHQRVPKQELGRLRHMYVVYGDGRVVTAGHRFRRLRSN